MEKYERYGIYYAPEAGAFADFCSSWLGWDAAKGQICAHSQMAGLPCDISEITETPRKYGFHGTIKPPMRLTGTYEDFLTDFNAICARLKPVKCDSISLAQLGRFLAFVVDGDTSKLAALAADVVKTMDAHRSPPNEIELEKRRKASLTSAQEAMLQAWGYPYVMDEFKFHLTMSGKMAKRDTAQVKAVLEPHVAHLIPRPFEVRDLCIFGEDNAGRFHLIERRALTG